VKKGGECRWSEETDLIPAEHLATRLDAIARNTGLQLETLRKGAGFDLRSLGAARGLLLLMLDRAVAWPAAPESTVLGDGADLDRALEAARAAIARQRLPAATVRPRRREDAISGWLALESGDRRRARSIVDSLADLDETRPLHIALAWQERDELALTAVVRQALAEDVLHRGRLDGARGEALCWDGFIRLAITDAGAIWREATWLSNCQLLFGDLSFDEAERAVLQRGKASGNPRSIRAACELLAFWDALIRARTARLAGEVAEELEAELPSARRIDATVLPGPLRSAADALQEIWIQPQAGEMEPEPAPAGPAAVVTRAEQPYRATIERGEVEQWRFIVPDAPEQALARAQEAVCALEPKWRPEERQRACCGLFVLACAAGEWQQAAEYLPDVLRMWQTLRDPKDWEDGTWLFIEHLAWDAPDRGSAVGMDTASEAQAPPAILDCLRAWNELVEAPRRSAPLVLERLGRVQDRRLTVTGMRQDLCRWWLIGLSSDDIEDPASVGALVSAYQLVGDEVPANGEVEARCLQNVALLMPEEQATTIADEWLKRWQRRLERLPRDSSTLREWQVFSAEIVRLWTEQVLDERAFWMWADCMLLEFDVSASTSALSGCARVFSWTAGKLTVASRMLDLVERLVDRVESATELGAVCTSATDWLRTTPAPPAARPHCRLLLELLLRVGPELALDLPDAKNLARRFWEVAERQISDYLPSSEVLKGKHIVVVGRRPSAFTRVRDILSEEDGAATVAHVPAGEGTGPRADVAASADWVLFLTTYVGHDDCASVEAALRRRGAGKRIVRLPDRRDGAHTIVQLLRRAALTDVGVCQRKTSGRA
jgi:hypothetical protein